MSPHNAKILSACALLLCALILQFSLAPFLPGIRTITLVTLITLSLFLPIIDLAALSLLGASLINWQPAFGFELFIFFSLPILVAFLRALVPVQLWIYNIVTILISLLIFYMFIVGYSHASPHFSLIMRFLEEAALGILWGSLLFHMFYYVYDQKN